MNSVESFLTLFVYGLATFRLAVLLSEDTGPARMFQRLRSRLTHEARQHPALRKTDIHHGIQCLRCSSVWVATPVAAFAYLRDQLREEVVMAGECFLLWMALSALAILLNRAFD